MSEKRGIVLDTLARMGIEYELWEHPAVYTIEEMDALPLKRPDVIAKNLFLRDAKGKRHFLVVLKNTATVVLKPADLLRVLEEHGNPVKQLHI